MRLILCSSQAWDSSDELIGQQVQAYHALNGIPSEVVTETTSTNEAVILNTYEAAEAAGFFEEYPFYSRYVIPAGTFSGVDEDVETFRDAGLWVISADTDEELVYQMTKAVYDQVGLYFMQEPTNGVASEMGPDTALVGVQTPLHPGAARYWERGRRNHSRSSAAALERLPRSAQLSFHLSGLDSPPLRALPRYAIPT